MRPLVMLLGPGQGGDSPMFPELMDSLRVARIGPGRARTRPDRLLGDKAYSSRANREFLRIRGIQIVIPERSDQVANRKRRGRNGGRCGGLQGEQLVARCGSIRQHLDCG